VRYYVVNDRTKIMKSTSSAQLCVQCGKVIGRNFAVSMNNNGDGLILKKNLWIHIGCVKAFANDVIKVANKHRDELLVNTL
jgi:hypothetical protein